MPNVYPQQHFDPQGTFPPIETAGLARSPRSDTLTH